MHNIIFERIYKEKNVIYFEKKTTKDGMAKLQS